MVNNVKNDVKKYIRPIIFLVKKGKIIEWKDP